MLSQAKDFLKNSGYEIQDYLGKGAYSIVYKCKNPYDELVAVKAFLCYNDDTREREFAAADELEKMKPLDWEKYPNFDFSDSFLERSRSYDEYINKPKVISKSSGRRFSIIECPLADKDTFDSVIRSSDPINYMQLSEIAKDVIKALQVIHARGLVHFDVKPDNILKLKQKDGTIKYQLCDFGFMSTKLSPKPGEHEHRRCGSYQYVAPEIKDCSRTLNSKELQKADIYSLGASLLQMCLAKKGQITRARNMPKTIEDFQSGMYEIEAVDKKESDFLDLIKKLTQMEPGNRPSAADVLNHPFFKELN